MKKDLKTALIKKKQNLLLRYGFKTGKVLPYEIELIERLKNIYYGGIPASIVLLMEPICNGKCYDRSMLITMGMDDFQLVNGDIKSLELKYGKDRANHSWAESKGWVYDTSMGLKIEKRLYYAIEQPVINKINNKQDCYNYFEYQEILNADLEKDKYWTILTLPLLEGIVPYCMYKDYLKTEIERFKQQIQYDSIYQEVKEDMIAKGFEKIKST